MEYHPKTPSEIEKTIRDAEKLDKQCQEHNEKLREDKKRK